MTFDWAQIAYIGSPLLTPWWAAANVVGGLVLVMWIVAPILCEWRSTCAITRSLTMSRLQECPVFRILAHSFLGGFRQPGKTIRRQQNPNTRIPFRSSCIRKVFQSLSTHNICPVIWGPVRGTFSIDHPYHLLAWQRHMAAVETSFQ